MKVPLSTILNEATPRRTGGERLLVHPICYCLTEDASHPAGCRRSSCRTPPCSGHWSRIRACQHHCFSNCIRWLPDKVLLCSNWQIIERINCWSVFFFLGHSMLMEVVHFWFLTTLRSRRKSRERWYVFLADKNRSFFPLFWKDLLRR
jgi:hypothetical protein